MKTSTTASARCGTGSIATGLLHKVKVRAEVEGVAATAVVEVVVEDVVVERGDEEV